MTRAIEIREPALEDIDAAGRWYEGQDEGLGEEFLAELERVLDRVAALPGQFPQHHGSVRRALLRRFPYAVFFDVTDSQAIVVAVLHQASHPSRLRRRSR
jgi:plasmid stabilization system protein ParE